MLCLVTVDLADSVTPRDVETCRAADTELESNAATDSGVGVSLAYHFWQYSMF